MKVYICDACSVQIETLYHVNVKQESHGSRGMELLLSMHLCKGCAEKVVTTLEGVQK